MDRAGQRQRLRQAAWLMVGNGLRLGLSGAYFILLARLLGPEAFGVFSAILACSNLAAPFGYWGQSELLIQRLSNRRSAAAAPEISPSLWLAGLGCGGMALLLAPLLSLWLAETSPLLVGILLASDLLFIAIPEVYRGILIGQEQVAGVALIDTGMALGRLGAVLLAVALGWGSLTQWAILYGLMVLAVLLLMARGMGRWSKPSPPLAWRDLGERLVAGWDFAVGLAAAKTFTDLDKLLLPRLASAAAGGALQRCLPGDQLFANADDRSAHQPLCRAVPPRTEKPAAGLPLRLAPFPLGGGLRQFGRLGGGIGLLRDPLGAGVGLPRDGPHPALA